MFFRNESFKDFIRYYPIVSIIIGFQLIVWLLMFFQLRIGDFIYDWGVGLNIAVSHGQYWRIVTPIFMHDRSGFTHILFNSFSLVLFGPALEQMLGRWKFSFVYLASGIIGNVFTYFVAPQSLNFHLGASGALFGLLGLYVYMSFFRPHLLDPVSKQMIIMFSLISLVMTFLRPGINVSAHLFGFVGGFALGPIVLTRAKPFSPSLVRRRVVVNDGTVRFDPNRWNKRGFRMKRNVSSIIWWVIFILAIIGLLGNFLIW